MVLEVSFGYIMTVKEPLPSSHKAIDVLSPCFFDMNLIVSKTTQAILVLLCEKFPEKEIIRF